MIGVSFPAELVRHDVVVRVHLDVVVQEGDNLGLRLVRPWVLQLPFVLVPVDDVDHESTVRCPRTFVEIA